MGFTPRFHSLDDFLAAKPLTIDGELDDGWGAHYPVKGREIEAAVLFADISSFSARSAELNPSETLAFVNHFFTWISAEALQNTRGIVDKYIGDELMIVFSKDFGSEDPFADAMHAARRIGSRDAFSFAPHIGVAYGKVIVGYVGTPVKFNCSVFGAAVTLASRCASVDVDSLIELEDEQELSPLYYSSSIVAPKADWGTFLIEDAFGDEIQRLGDPGTQTWEELAPKPIDMKNLGEVEVVGIVRRSINMMQGYSAEQHAKDGVASLIP